MRIRIVRTVSGLAAAGVLVVAAPGLLGTAGGTVVVSGERVTAPSVKSPSVKSPVRSADRDVAVERTADSEDDDLLSSTLQRLCSQVNANGSSTSPQRPLAQLSVDELQLDIPPSIQLCRTASPAIPATGSGT